MCCVGRWTHGSEGVGDSEPDGGDEGRDEGEGQESEHRQCDDSTQQSKDPTQAHAVLCAQHNGTTAS